MMESNQPQTAGASRRDFLKASAIAGGVAAANLSLLSNVHAAGSDTIKVGLIGCGGRGTGAARNVLQSAPGVRLVAMGDVFRDHVENGHNDIKGFAEGDDRVKQLGNKVDVSQSNRFDGLDAYKKVLASGIDYVILATPPGFRPIHLEAAVAAGKVIFTEKPVAVDGTGIRRVLAAYHDAKSRGLHVVAGTQRRHQLGYLETMKRIHEGAIGDIVCGRAFWMQNHIWGAKDRPRKPGMTDVAYAIHNWYGHPWLSGDHIVEQHVHNLDVMNWALRTHPVRAIGMGYRTQKNNDGVNYNFFAVNYEWPNDTQVISMCRQIDHCVNSVSEYLIGTKGHAHVDAYVINGQRAISDEADRSATDPYVQEHTDLIESVRKGRPINELKNVAESTLTAIMGRMSAYTGQAVTWDQALHSTLHLMPDNLTLDGKVPSEQVAMPGRTRLV
jgi:predicted dehydrogenase